MKFARVEILQELAEKINAFECIKDYVATVNGSILTMVKVKVVSLPPPLSGPTERGLAGKPSISLRGSTGQASRIL